MFELFDNLIIFVVKFLVVCLSLFIISMIFPIWLLITALITTVIITIIKYMMATQKAANAWQEQAYQEWVDSKRLTK